MKINNTKCMLATIALLPILGPSLAWSAVALDRTRVIFYADQSSVSLTVTNKNTQLPYLAQGWIENEQSQKVSSPFVVLPPVQRLEPETTSQVRIEALQEIAQLPQDRESLFYFNLREIPPKSDKPNVLQLALQSKIKLFYRPKGIEISDTVITSNPWQEKLTLTIKNGDYIANNPTPFYITIIGASATKDTPVTVDFNAVMIPPFDEKPLNISSLKIGLSPVLTYINDYGARLKLQVKCQNNQCIVIPDKKL